LLFVPGRLDDFFLLAVVEHWRQLRHQETSLASPAERVYQ
jgi:hypothetical protein